MNNRSVGNVCKNAIGTMFLLMGAFFVCSTLLSMRAVFADPIAPVNDNTQPVQQSGRTSARANPRRNTSATVRPTRQTSANRTVSGRTVASRTNTRTANTTATPARTVVARTAANRQTVASRGTTGRTVRARTTSDARVSLSGDAIRGSKGVNSTYYTYLNGKLYTGNYSNIIDSTTGLISADAYSTCLESYYTCMDEICTARNEAQRRCACAGRVKSFAAAEDALESANAELLKIAGQVALLNMSKGKEVSAAFSLTDAEKVMNCVSWREASNNGTSKENFGEWCAEHGLFDSRECSYQQSPKYCDSGENGNLFDIDDLDGTSSDILATLSLWADTIKDNTNTILNQDNDAVAEALASVGGVINGLTGSVISLEDEVEDKLSETWGYDLFGYAHNNVCSRVLDSCFNGIYEGCGTPPSGGRCANGANSSCPYNYNSKVTITSTGDVTLNERSTNTANSSASCFGYTSTSGDPYSALRGPVADARRSIMQKYLLDANADCDSYGEQLKTAAQKINYQKVAAQQALQQKRLEFYNEEQDKVLSDAIAAGTNFNECISELYDCYETQESAHPAWPEARIKTYCAQISNSPHCYQDMICNPSDASFKAIIDKADSDSCTWHSSDYTQNTCRNVVTLNEILNKASDNVADSILTNGAKNINSANLREKCLREALGCTSADGLNGDGCIRSWKRTSATNN